MQIQSSMSELDEQLSAYFDGELDGAVREQFGAGLEHDEELASQLADLSFLHEMVVGDLEHQAERVPEARFEQIWDSFEQTLERESRLQEAAETPPGLVQRLLDWVAPRRLPLAALGAAAALVFVFARSAGQPSDGVDDQPNLAEKGSNTQEGAPSDAQPAKAPLRPEAQPDANPSVGAGSLAVAPAPSDNSEMFPQPEPGEAEIRRIEFGGRSGTISQVEGSRGTTTVIWVTDELPIDSERSL